jgi:hypothetical protein
MSAIRTILWVGRGERFPAQVADAPLLDVVFERDVDSAAGLPLAGFDACVVDVPEPCAALDALQRLRLRRDCPPVLVRLDRGVEEAAALARAGAADVVLRTRDDESPSELVARLRSPGRSPSPAGGVRPPASTPQGGASAQSHVAVARHDPADSIARLPGGGEPLLDVGSDVRLDAEHHAESHVEDAVRLVRRDATAGDQEREDRGRDQRRTLDLDRRARREHARQVVGQPATGDVRHRGDQAILEQRPQRR